MKLGIMGARILAIVADGGALRARRLFPGPWRFEAMPRAVPGDPIPRSVHVTEAAVVKLAMCGFVHGEFAELGQNTHLMHYTLTEAGRDALTAYEADPDVIARKNKQAKKGAA